MRSDSMGRARRLFVGAIAVITASWASAYWVDYDPWADGTVTLELQFGDESGPLLDGAGSWNQVAQSAIAIWNANLDTITLVGNSESPAPVGEENGFSNLYFSDTVYGDTFGGALAVTIAYGDVGSNRTEADVIFNESYNWNSYRGPLRAGVDDFRRVAIHEIGHVLGLNHPDELFEFVNAIMNSTVNDFDTLQADDVEGIEFLYSGIYNSGGTGAEDDHGGLFASATVVSSSSPQSAFLGFGDVDYFRVDLPQGGSVEASTTGLVDTYGILFRGDGELQAFQDDVAEDDLNFRFVAGQLEPGTYYLQVTGADKAEQGSYQLTLVASDDQQNGDVDEDTIESAVDIVIGEPVEAAINYNFDLDYYRVVLPQPGALELSSTSDMLTSGGLLNAAGDILAGALGTEDEGDFSLTTRNLPAGEYFIEVTALFGLETGNYILNTNFEPLAAEIDRSARLVNLSVNTQASGEHGTLIAGFSTTGDDKLLLARAVGPTLSSFGVTDYLIDPTLMWFDAQGATLAENDDWWFSEDILELITFAEELGAFELGSFSEAALLARPQPGQYTLHVDDTENEAGRVLVEVYDADGELPVGRLVNLSTRTQVGAGANVLTAGFVVEGEGTLRVLIRGIGPTLADFGVAGTLEDPRIVLFDSGSASLGENDDWGSQSAEISTVSASVGAFALTDGSADAAMLVELAPGAYTVQLSGKNDGTGEGLIEIYAAP